MHDLLRLAYFVLDHDAMTLDKRNIIRNSVKMRKVDACFLDTQFQAIIELFSGVLEISTLMMKS